MLPPARSLSAQFALVAAAALGVGLLDAALVAGDLLGARGAFQFVPLRIWVVAPAIWLLIATVLAVVVFPLLRRSGGPTVATLLVGLLLVIRLRAHPAILVAAIIVFALLLARTAPWMARWLTRPRRGTAMLIAGLICLGATMGTTYSPSPRSAAVTDRPAGPNVIVVFLDTVRYDALFDEQGRAHADLPTLARLQHDSTVFTRAFSSSPWTLPAHLAALTGIPVHELGVGFDAQVYRRSDPTLAERFHRRGYRTTAVISNSFLNAGTGVARGFDTFEQAEAGLDVCRTAPGLLAERHWPWFSATVCNWTATDVTRRALASMDDSDRPFFLALNYMDAHDPYYVERSCGEANGYRAAIRCLDRQLAPIVDWRSRRAPTILALVGDHGEQFGEHGLRRHGNSLYVQLLHVPLVLRAANAAGTRVETAPINTSSLLALLDGTPIENGPLTALLHPPAASREPSQWSAFDGTWHLIADERGREELYQVSSDPAETRNRIAADGSGDAIAVLRDTIARMRRAPKPDLRRFRALGYIH